jgi:two-component system, cell cycle response regulator CpdR
MRNRVERIDPLLSRAICAEIAERLRVSLSNDQSPPPTLLAQRLDQPRQIEEREVPWRRRTKGEEPKSTALVVENDQAQRAMVALLLEETDIQVIQCESAEAAELVLEKVGGCLCMMFTDVNLAGRMTGAELATKARQRFPSLKVIVTSGRNPPDLPEGTIFMPKPWRALDVLREAELSRH